jgi:hypothetical protein
MIMRYVADAPLRSLRSDLGLSPQGTTMMPFASVRSSDQAAAKTRLHTLETALSRLEEVVAGHASEIATMTAEATADIVPKYVRHTVTATVHRIRPSDASRTICGISISGATFMARRQDNSKCYLPLDSLQDIPGVLMCDRCLNKERSLALNSELVDAAISGDEVED